MCQRKPPRPAHWHMACYVTPLRERFGRRVGAPLTALCALVVAFLGRSSGAVDITEPSED